MQYEKIDIKKLTILDGTMKGLLENENKCFNRFCHTKAGSYVNGGYFLKYCHLNS